MPVGVRTRVVLVILHGVLVLTRPSIASTQESAECKAALGTRKDAEGGDPAAQFKMGVRYEYGEGLSQDYAQAAAWYQLTINLSDVPRDKLREGVLGLPARGSTMHQVAERQVAGAR